MIQPLTRLRLSQARTQAEALRAWHDHAEELEGYSFVISEPTGNNAIRLPARMNYPGGGHLRSVFTHDNLYFISHQIIRKTLAEGLVHLPVDYTIAFDSNVASYLRSWMKGTSSTLASMLQRVLLQLNKGRFNWDLIPFLLERSEAFLAGRDSTEIYETALASEWLGCCDLDTFSATGVVRPTLPKAEIEAKARQALADWRTLLQEGQMEAIQHRFALFHANIAKMVLLHLASPGSSTAAAKLEDYIHFADTELSCVSQLCASAALEFFARGSAFSPMAKVSNCAPELRKRIRNVAWDFLQLQWRQEFAGQHGRNGGFHIPLFLTFDHGLAELADVFPQRSCLYGGDLPTPIFFQDYDYPVHVLDRHPELTNLMGKVFTLEGLERRATRLRESPPNLEQLIDDLENQLAKYEHT